MVIIECDECNEIIDVNIKTERNRGITRAYMECKFCGDQSNISFIDNEVEGLQDDIQCKREELRSVEDYESAVELEQTLDEMRDYILDRMDILKGQYYE